MPAPVPKTRVDPSVPPPVIRGVGTGVEVAVAVVVAVALAVAVPVTVAVWLGVCVCVGVPVAVWVDVTVAVELAVGVLEDVPVGDAVAVSVAVPVTVAVSVTVVVAVGVAEGGGGPTVIWPLSGSQVGVPSLSLHPFGMLGSTVVKVRALTPFATPWKVIENNVPAPVNCWVHAKPMVTDPTPATSLTEGAKLHPPGSTPPGATFPGDVVTMVAS